jgi:mycofactocin system glycosyltransferase
VISAAVPLPEGFRITLDPGTRRLTEGLWLGGSPLRALRLTAKGRRAWSELARGPVATTAAGVVARRFIDAGLAHPLPPSLATTPEVTVVIPVYNRAALLDRCLAALGGRYPTLVVDDGSPERTAVATVAARHGATLIRRSANGGAAAARNTGLAHVKTELVAFVDSDCAPGEDWVDRLVGHFADPAVAVVAPRVTPLAADSWSGRYTRAASSLDLGDRPARVLPHSRVPYVPTAALIARCRALASVARDGEVFDRAMTIGEDVDLVWRLHEVGWRIRYDPSVQVGHHEPGTWRGLLARRHRYGTSAAPLAIRHPGNLTHLILSPWPALTVGALLARRPLLAAGSFAVSVGSTRRALRAMEIPADRVPTVAAAAQTFLGVGQYATRFAAPLLLALALPGGRNRWGRRASVGSLLLAAPLAGWVRRRPALDPIRYTLAALADDVAYGAGVWSGCLAHRTTRPLRPALARRPTRAAAKRT